MKNITTKMMAQGAVIAAVYVVLTLAFAPISFGAIIFVVVFFIFSPLVLF